ncbi:MAG: hypothetical protein U5K32_00495 [Bacteroidales bacterium]|nr:hypothetical protein [Bacteroidales bacterium]
MKADDELDSFQGKAGLTGSAHCPSRLDDLLNLVRLRRLACRMAVEKIGG